MKNISIIGSGSWGVALGIHLAKLGNNIKMWSYKKEEADKLLLLGDVLYHGPRNDLPDGYNPKSVIGMLNGIKNEILCVRGNCDTEVDQMVLEFPVLADYAVFYDGKSTIYATHGHVYNEAKLPPLNNGDILLHGHTHVLKCEEFGNENFYINPGSISLPKENNPKTYIVYENRTFTCFDLNGNVIFKKTF